MGDTGKSESGKTGRAGSTAQQMDKLKTERTAAQASGDTARVAQIDEELSQLSDQ